MKVGFIGYGEAAYNISLGLGNEGLTGIIAYDAMMDDAVMGRQVHSRADEAKVSLVASAAEVADKTDVLFASVPSSFTLDVCRAVKDHLRAGQIYADVSASTPKTKIEIWDLIKDTGVLFADAAMLGSLPKDKHKVPITASGNGAAKFKETMEPHGMKITLAGEKAGAASAIKLVRSIYMKGIATLLFETLQAAVAYGVEAEVVDSVTESMTNTPFPKLLDRLVTGSAIHCKRRGAEMKGSIEMCGEAGISYAMTEATKHWLESLIEYDFAKKYSDHQPSGWREIIDAIKVK